MDSVLKHCKKPIASVLAAIVLTGCSGNQFKENLNSAVDSTSTFISENRHVVGSVVGAVIGYTVSGKNDRGLGILAGALVGGVVADQLGKYLDQKDRAALETYSLDQMNNSIGQTESTWRSEESGASVKVTTKESVTKKKPIEVVKLKQVKIVPDIDLIGENYVAKTSLNVRYSPEVRSDNKVGRLRKNAQFTAVGRTQDNWILVAQEGVTVGYVSGKPAHVEPIGSTVSMLRDGGIDLDSLDENAVTAGIDLDGINLDTVEVDKTEMVATTECRDVEYEISTSDGKAGTTSYNVCRGSDGAWELG